MEEAKNIKKEWNDIIAAKLKGGVTLDDLKYEYPSGIVMEPNILSEDIKEYDHSIQASKPWINMASIKGGSSSEKNSFILQALQYGANGLSIELASTDAIKDILKDVLTEYLDVRLDCSILSMEEITHQQSQIDPTEFPNVKWVGDNVNYKQIFIGTEKRVENIKIALEEIKSDLQADVIVSLSKNLLFEIASLRALRALLADTDIQSFQILARYDVEGSNDLGDYDLIEKTYKVISGVLGGADAILTDYTNDEASRLTLNIHNVLDLESGMKNVLDPLSGSYYIEKLTGEIIRQVKGV